jgi:hypothetical protein
LSEDFRCDVIRRSNGGEGQLSVSDVLRSLIDLTFTKSGISIGNLFINISQIISSLIVGVLTLRLDFNVLAQTKITQLDVTVFTDNEIIGLQISMDVVEIMNAFDG